MNLNSTYVAPSQPLRNKTNVLNVSRNSNNITKAKAHVPSKAAQRRAEKRLAEQLLLSHLKDLVSYQEFLFSITQPGPNLTKTRYDVLSGTNGAPIMTKLELEMFDILQRRISGGRGTAKTFFYEQLEELEFQKASLVFTWLMEGKDAIIPGTNFTYKHAKLLVARAESSEYFKKMQMEAVAAIKKEKEEPTTPINTQVNAVMGDFYKYLADM